MFTDVHEYIHTRNESLMFPNPSLNQNCSSSLDNRKGWVRILLSLDRLTLKRESYGQVQQQEIKDWARGVFA